MAVREVVLYPDPPLKEVAKPVTVFDDALLQLAQDLVETMHDYEGVGLAAPQVGVSLRMVAIGPPDEDDFCLVNPELSQMEGRVDGEEGCLSLPQLYATVPRAEKLHVCAFDPTGQRVEFDVEGFVARIIQHECDHLDGKVFPDRVDILSREGLLREWADKRQEILSAVRPR